MAGLIKSLGKAVGETMVMQAEATIEEKRALRIEAVRSGEAKKDREFRASEGALDRAAKQTERETAGKVQIDVANIGAGAKRAAAGAASSAASAKVEAANRRAESKNKTDIQIQQMKNDAAEWKRAHGKKGIKGATSTDYGVVYHYEDGAIKTFDPKLGVMANSSEGERTPAQQKKFMQNVVSTADSVYETLSDENLIDPDVLDQAGMKAIGDKPPAVVLAENLLRNDVPMAQVSEILQGKAPLPKYATKEELTAAAAEHTRKLPANAKSPKKTFRTAGGRATVTTILSDTVDATRSKETVLNAILADTKLKYLHSEARELLRGSAE